MTVQIKLAQTTDELDAVFRLRHQVMVEEEGYMGPLAEGRMADRFDAFPTTVNVVALVEGRIVGAVRFIERTPAGTSADEYFDFSPHLPAGARDVATSLLVVERRYRGTPRLVFSMMAMGYYWAIRRGLTHVLAALNPERREAFVQSGYRIVAEEFRHAEKGLPVLPMVLDLRELNDRFLAFLRLHGIDHWLDAFGRQFHVAGETVMRRGEPGDAAYVIVDGTAGVLGADGRTSVAEMGPGELFGELALLTSGPRSADVVALTDLDLMTLDRDDFRRQIRERPAAERLLELLAGRLTELIERRYAGRA